MQFNSYVFIQCFSPMTVFLYFLANRIKPFWGKMILIVASIVFYSMGRINMLFYLGISILINYFFALLIKKFEVSSRILVVAPVAINVALLLYFKYLNFVLINVNQLWGTDIPLKNIVLPLGISFYTFQQIAYIVATAKHELSNNNLIDYLSYILYFPKLVMGPIVEPVDFIEQINDENKKCVNWDNVAIGTKIFSLGLIKKVLLADTFAKAVAWIYENLETATAMECILL